MVVDLAEKNWYIIDHAGNNGPMVNGGIEAFISQAVPEAKHLNNGVLSHVVNWDLVWFEMI